MSDFADSGMCVEIVFRENERVYAETPMTELMTEAGYTDTQTEGDGSYHRTNPSPVSTYTATPKPLPAQHVHFTFR